MSYLQASQERLVRMVVGSRVRPRGRECNKAARQAFPRVHLHYRRLDTCLKVSVLNYVDTWPRNFTPSFFFTEFQKYSPVILASTIRNERFLLVGAAYPRREKKPGQSRNFLAISRIFL